MVRIDLNRFKVTLQLLWLPFVNDYRTFLGNPGVDGRRVLEEIDKFPMSA